MVKVELIFITADQVINHYHLTMPTGTTVADAIEASGIINLYPEAANLSVGIFAKLTARTAPIKAGDRIEIYRPLTADPKDKRRARAKKSVL